MRRQLDRKDVWPDNSNSKGQRIRSSIDGSTWWKDLFGKVKAKVGGRGKGVKRVNVRGEELNKR